MSDRPISDIGWTFEEAGTTTLPNGSTAPHLVGHPNDREAHRQLMEAVRRGLEEEG